MPSFRNGLRKNLLMERQLCKNVLIVMYKVKRVTLNAVKFKNPLESFAKSPSSKMEQVRDIYS